LGLNCARGYQADGKFGKALSFLLDRETLIRVILGGSGEPPTYEIPGRPDLALDLAQPFMPDSAEYYLDAVAGPPRSVNLYVDSRYPILANVSRYLVGQLQKQGIKVVERRVDFQWVEESSARTDLDLYLTCYIPVAANPECVFYPLLDDGLSGETNFLNFNDEAIQAFLDRLHSEAAPDKRDNLTRGLVQAITTEPPVIFLYKPYLTTIAKDDVGGAEQDPMGYVDLRRAFIETGK
jgi:ABC-type transport system substrate-binding protein